MINLIQAWCVLDLIAGVLILRMGLRLRFLSILILGCSLLTFSGVLGTLLIAYSKVIL